MSEAGCYLVSLGIESGSNKILKNMNKMSSVFDHEKALRLLNKVGIIAQCGFIIGFPGETKSTIEETYNFIIRNKIRLANIQPFTIRSTKMLILNDVFKKRFKIKINKISDDIYNWSHSSMDLESAITYSKNIKNQLKLDPRSKVSFRRNLERDLINDLNKNSDPYFYYDTNNLIQKSLVMLKKGIINKEFTKIKSKLFNNYIGILKNDETNEKQF